MVASDTQTIPRTLVRSAHRTRIPVLAIVMPCFNEEEILADSIAKIGVHLSSLIDRDVVSAESFVCLVDDGSVDRTWEIAGQATCDDPRFSAIRFSRNFGHQAAVLAGLNYAFPHSDCVISIDSDLQQDINAIELFVAAYMRGADVVLGIRNARTLDTPFKRATAEGFYVLMKAMGVALTRNHADYRLLSRRAVETLAHYPESNLFLRGIVHIIGFPVEYVHFDVFERQAGVSKYNLRKMLKLAMDGITSFSIVPLRIIAVLGATVTAWSFVMGSFVLWAAIFSDSALPGWASTVLPIYLLGGIQLLCLGVIGEYIGKIYIESKRRPQYNLADKLGCRQGGI